jgi:3-oxoacyl-[acyl-carrier-protein] synthase II
MNDSVVVTGVGAVTPLGMGADTLLAEWSSGRCATTDGVGSCDRFELGELLSANDIRRTNRFTQMALAACEEALGNAGWGTCVPFDPYRVACVVGTGFGGVEIIEREHDGYCADGATACAPACIPLMTSNAAAATLSMRYGLHGPSAAPASACAAGAEAVALGAGLIRSGEVDAALVGGAESAISGFMRAAFAANGELSRTGVCRPFDARRDGFVIGEGAGMLVLESEEAARRRAATELARLVGIGVTCDGFHPTAPDPGAEAAARAIDAALTDAGIAAEDVDYVNAYGAGGQLDDRAETRALKTALGTHAHTVPISSAKSAIGHLLGAAGAVQALATVLALRRGIAPPTLGYEVPDEELDLDYNADGRTLRSQDGSLVGLSNSFGHGGQNVVLAFEAQAIRR